MTPGLMYGLCCLCVCFVDGGGAKVSIFFSPLLSPFSKKYLQNINI